MESGLDDFLKETKYCDFNNSEIGKLAHKIAYGYENQKDKATAAFYWVRDNILYRVGAWNRKASETLEEREGTCTNKANLLVALLRALGIPAGYGVMKVYGQRYFGPIAVPMLRKFIGEFSTHIYAVVYLNGKWIKCDPSDDKELSENTSHFNFTSKLVEFNGGSDAMLNLNTKDILENKYPIVNIDPWMIKRPKHAKGIPLEIANLYIKFARKNKIKVADAKELESLFKKWLRINNPFYFYSFILALWLKNLKISPKK